MVLHPLVRLKEGHFRFVAEFEWDIGMDEDARRRFMPIFKGVPRGIDADTFQAYYLTSERRLIMIGQTQSSLALQELTAKICYESAIEGRVYHSVEAHDMQKLFSRKPTVPGRNPPIRK